MSYVTLWTCKTGGVLFQVEPNTKLFPAVLVQPSNQNMVQLELGKLKVRTYFCSHTIVWLLNKYLFSDSASLSILFKIFMPHVLSYKNEKKKHLDTTCHKRLIMTTFLS